MTARGPGVIGRTRGARGGRGGQVGLKGEVTPTLGTLLSHDD
jgi:hypothetical protein